MAWPCPLTVSPHSFLALVWGMEAQWRIFKNQSTSMFFPGLFTTHPHWKENAQWGMLTPTQAFVSWRHLFVSRPRPPASRWLTSLTLFFILAHRSTRSEAHTGVNTAPTSCGGLLPKGSDAQVGTELSFPFSIYIKRRNDELEGISPERGNRPRLAQKSSFLEDSRHLCA